MPVFTGQINDSTQKRGKHRDFVFFEAKESNPIPVPPGAWRDFLRIHGDEGESDAMSWPGYWKKQFRQNKDVPVFYLQDKGLLRIGLAFMPKLAGDFSTLDMIAHASPEHLQAPGAEHGYDFADLLFGAINGEVQADALRGRVSFELARAEGKPQVEKSHRTILNGPKPSYFPNYITQKANSNSWKLPGDYATYLETPESKAPTLRGFKRYPARPDAQVQALTAEQEKNRKVQIELNPLAPGARFKGRIVFHNLKPQELGALLWAMTWNDHAGFRHGLGMGKPFGFGQVHFELDHAASQIAPNNPVTPEVTLDAAHCRELTVAFERHMEAVVPQWGQSPQLLNLLAMADPSAASQLPASMELRHMRLEQACNEFNEAKRGKYVLADYAVATGRMDSYQPTQGKPRLPKPVAVKAGLGTPSTAGTGPDLQVRVVRWEAAKLTWICGSCRLTATPAGGGKQAIKEQATQLLNVLPEPTRERLRKRGELADVTVEVEIQGNRLTIIRLIASTK